MANYMAEVAKIHKKKLTVKVWFGFPAIFKRKDNYDYLCSN